MSKNAKFKKDKPDFKDRRGKSKNKVNASQEKMDAREEKVTTGTNHDTWYNKYPELVRDAGSLPFAYPLGYKYHLGEIQLKSYGSENLVPVHPRYVSPGIFTLIWGPTIGYSDAATSPINVAATNVYSYVRHAQSGHANYEASDLMLYLMAMDSVYAGISYLRRIYKTAMLYNPKNRYFPRVALKAMNVDPDLIFKDLANFRYWINQLTVKAAAFNVPKNMPLFDRHAWMSENIYTDASTATAQSYMFVLARLYRYSEGTAENPKLGYLQSTNIESRFKNAVSAWEIVDTIDSLLQPIVSSEAMNIMSGDILKAYGSENLVKLNLLDENEVVIPLYDERVLAQIHNSTAVNLTNNEDLMIQQHEHEHYLVSLPTGSSTLMNGFKFLLNTRFDAPTPEDVVSNTRIMTLFDTNGRMSSGTEVIFNYKLFTYSIENDQKDELISLSTLTAFSNLASDLILQMYKSAVRLTQFDWHPLVYVVVNSSTNTQPLVGNQDVETLIFGDINNATPIDWDTINQLHNTALLSEFDA